MSLRLPITRCTGNGNSLSSVGVTMIPSASARCGCSSRSTISSSCPEAKCSSQIALALAMARSEFGALPATYRRNRSLGAFVVDFGHVTRAPAVAILAAPSLRARSRGDADVLVGVTHLAQHRPVGLQQLGRRSGGVGQDRDLGAAGLHFRLDDLQPRGRFGLRELQLQPLELRGDLGALRSPPALPVPTPSGPRP